MSDRQLTMFDDVPQPKLCECGCGLPVQIAKRNFKHRGILKGQHLRFIRGHGHRGKCVSGFKQCNQCGESKPATTEFFHSKAGCGKNAWSNLAPMCKECYGKSQEAMPVEARKVRRSQAKARRLVDPIGFNEKRKLYREALKREMVQAYGDGTCACCGESEIDFLTLEHIAGGGRAHRKVIGGGGHRTYQHLRKRGWPQDGYSVLCWNCNCASGHHSVCPHKGPAVDLESLDVNKRCRIKLKMEMVAAYGGKCSCCGIEDFRFLTLEHVNRDGKAHRESLGGKSGTLLYPTLKKLGWPQDGYTVLCYNCNCAAAHTGICPHKRPKTS